MLRFRDIYIALIILFVVPVIHYGIDSGIYYGKWWLKYEYTPLFIIPILSILICASAKPAPLFLTGVSLAFTLALAVSMANDFIWPRHDLRGLDYLFGSLGAMVGALISLVIHKYKKHQVIESVILLSFIGSVLGFFITQQVLCNTVIYCGPFSLMHYTQ